ncbi:MAG: RHS repeat-associated core domain-containing protein [Candidatus Eremiobacterota bacterium]
MTDAENLTVTFSRDPDGRVMSTTLPDGRVVGTDYDATGNLTSLTPPGRPAHGFDYDSRNLNTFYRPPTVTPGGPTQYDYNLDSQPTLTTRPDGDTVLSGYDLAGRLQTLTIPRGVFTYSYDSVTGKPTSVTGPGGSSRTYGYQGGLPASLGSAGPVNGTVAWAYDNSFRTTGRTVSGGGVIAMSYDADDLVTAVGAMAMARNVQNGLLTGTTLGSVTDSLTYSSFGEVSSYTASGSTGQLYSETYQRDKLGRITQRTETIQGVTTTWTHSYDTAGRLARVDRNGTLCESYGYDSNDNRVSVTSPGGTTTATFDDQDRILTNGSVTFAHDGNGDLVSKTDASGTTLYDYDTTGQLLSVTKPNGDIVSYELGANNRRAVKRVNGVVQRKWLYSSGLLPVAEHDASDNLVAVFNGSYLVKNGATYRLLRDHIGSVRLVVDVGTGLVVQRLSYDPWGNVTEDTNPGFQPFGYAGGLYDPDTGLVRFGARDYQPETGRWTCKDPLGISMGNNMYAYCNNDPLNHYDPTGYISSVHAAILQHLAYYGIEETINIVAAMFPGDPKIEKAKNLLHEINQLIAIARGGRPNCGVLALKIKAFFDLFNIEANLYELSPHFKNTPTKRAMVPIIHDGKPIGTGHYAVGVKVGGDGKIMLYDAFVGLKGTPLENYTQAFSVRPDAGLEVHPINWNILQNQ